MEYKKEENLAMLCSLYNTWRARIVKAMSGADFDDCSLILDSAKYYVKNYKAQGGEFIDFIDNIIRVDGKVYKSDNFQRRLYEMFYGWENFQVVIFSGKQGSGKTTSQEALKRVAAGIIDQFDTNVTVARCKPMADKVCEFNFADPIHEENDHALARLREVYGVPHNIVKSRKFMQFYGSDFGRDELGKQVWIDILKNRVNEANTHTPVDGKKHLLIIGDCRFENEFNSFPQAFRIRLHAPEESRKARAKKWGDVKHRSEIGLDKYANAGKFDLYIDTAELDAVKGPEHVTSLVMSRLQRGEWVERRGRADNTPTFQEEIYSDVEYPT